MNEIKRKFKELRQKREKAFIAYICAGDPSLSVTKKMVFALQDAGVDLIELGIPFSDPLADGPTIQRASERSLKNRTNLKGIFSLSNSVKNKLDIPIALMGYFNPIYRYGIEKFSKDAKRAGISGVIVPDLPPEEADGFMRSAKKYGLATIFLLAPTSTNERIRLVGNKSQGFIYYVSLTGTTGERKTLPRDIAGGVARIRKFTKKPVCVGFGVSTEKQVRDISRFADGVVVGSAIVSVVERNLRNKNLIAEVYKFTSKLVRALKMRSR